MQPEEMFAAIAQQRRRLADTLAELDDDAWDHPTLCAGWRVRDVVGHLVSILEVPVATFLRNAVNARGFDRYADQVAREIGARAPAELLAGLRAAADKRFAPPLVGPIAPLTDVFAHTRDIERPLGRPCRLDPAVLPVVLQFLCGRKARLFVPRRRIKGLRFEASDVAWTAGAGPTVAGPAEALMLALCGRSAAVSDLAGDGAGELARRLLR